MGGASRKDFLNLLGLGAITLLTSGFRDGSSLLTSKFSEGPYAPYVRRGDETINKVCLTFDDGYTPYANQMIIDTLNRYKVPATFFVVGRPMEWYYKQWQYAIDSGHEILNHSYSHQYLNNPNTDLEKEVLGWEEIYRKYFGEPEKIIRMPYGAGHKDDRLHEWLGKHGYRGVVEWSQAAHDTDNDEVTQKNIRRIIDNLSYLRCGDICLLHLKEVTAKALPKIIQTGVSHGFEFVKLTDLPGLGLLEKKIEEPEIYNPNIHPEILTRKEKRLDFRVFYDYIK